MTACINNDLDIQGSFFGAEEPKHGSKEARREAVSIAFAKVADRLDEGKSDPETLELLRHLKAALIAAAGDKEGTPTSLIPILPGVPTPQKLLPGVPTPTSLIQTTVDVSDADVKDKLFAWIKIYTLNAIYSMPGSMLANSDAIQTYMSDGLNMLSKKLMDQSQAWSAYNQSVMKQIETQLSHDASLNPKDDPSVPNKCEADTTAFNMQNTFYQKTTEMFGSEVDQVTQNSSQTSQTQTLNNQNIVQGPLAMLQMLVQCWSVIA